MADLDPAILTGTVTGYFYIGDPDSPDVGTQADLGLVNGKISISPTLSPPYVRTSKGLLFLRSGVLQVINSVLYGPAALDGSTTPAAAVGATLIATDQAELNPSNFQWLATFSFTGVTPNPAPVTFSLPAGTNVDLSLAYNTPASNPALQVVVSDASKNAAAASAAAAAQSATDAQNAANVSGRTVATASALPTAASSAGKSYYVTDTAVVVISDGTRWRLIYGDTGVRDVKSLITDSNILQTGGNPPSGTLRRYGNNVEFYCEVNYVAAPASPLYLLNPIPAGFRPDNSRYGIMVAYAKVSQLFSDGTKIYVFGAAANDVVRYTGHWLTTDAWPAVLPGTQAVAPN